MLIESRVIDRSAQEAAARLSARASQAVRRGLLKVGFALGRKVNENIEDSRKWPTAATRALGRSFLVPEVGGGETVSLGTGGGGAAPMIYAGIQEEGGVIEAKAAPYLTFEYPPGSGQWVRKTEVEIPAKHYGRDAVADMEHAHEAPLIMAGELAEEFRG